METQFPSQPSVVVNDRDVNNTIVMKKVFRISPIIFAVILLLLARGCTKEDPESLTQPVSNLSKTGATLNGTVNPNGLSTKVTFEYGTTTSYDSTVTASQSPVTGNGIKNVSADITGLTIGKTYHYRVKAENSHWTVYSSDMEFEYGYPPVVTTLEVTTLKSTKVTLNGNVNANGLSTTVTFEYGTSTDYGHEVKPEQNMVIGNSITNVSAGITGLTIGTTYHFRVKAENSFGPVYGNDSEFEFGYPPSVSTLEVTDLTSTATTLNAAINARGLPTIVTFEYGTTTDYGGQVTPEQNPITGNSITNISANISGLTCSTIYHCRLKAENSFDTTYSSDKTFLTPSGPPDATTLEAVKNTCTTVTLNGSVQGMCSSFVVTFQYGTDMTSYDQELTPDQTLVTADDITEVSRNISGLTPGTTYHFRLKAESSFGTSYGSDKTINTGLSTLTTKTVSGKTATTAISGGDIPDSECSLPITDRGVESFRIIMVRPGVPYKTDLKITHDGTGTGSFTSNLTGLIPSTTYNVRAYATNSAGTVYGNTISFRTASSGK